MMVVFGTRPEAIKLLPVIAALRARNIDTRVAITGQQRQLLDQMLGPQRIGADFDLDLMRPNASLPDLAARLLSGLGKLFARERPHRVIVQGDTATALAAAQAAHYSGIPIAHVEAGLRSGRLDNPHPEEGNRRMIGALADLHFAPTASAAEALAREGVSERAIQVTGNTVVDALLAAQSRLKAHPELAQSAAPVLASAGGKKLILVTCHRRESFGPALHRILTAIIQLAARDDVAIAFVMHPNPNVCGPVRQALGGAPNVMLLDPLDFLSFVQLLSLAHLALSDSGGVQEEAPVLGTPLLVMRDCTERPEGIDAGTAMLVGTRTERIVAEACRLLDDPLARARMARKHSPFGDGHAADRIADAIAAAHGYARSAAALIQAARRAS